MITLTTAEVASITGGRLSTTADPDATIHSVTTDSREVGRGALFVAKPGEFTDGHVFIPQALDAGAALVLAERDTEAGRGVAPAVIVDDVVIAMKDLATEVVDRVRALGRLKVVGITGSAGKTTTKDLVAAVLSRRGETVKPVNSYNGEIGLPLTVFDLTETTEYLVAEMGATHVGNIAYLAEIVKPDVGVVLMIGTAHVGEFGGVQNIVATKGELVEALGADGVAVLNADDSRVMSMRTRTSARVLTFGESSEAQVRAEKIGLDADGHPCFDLVAAGSEPKALVSGLIGRHHVHNVLAAAAACLALGLDVDEVVRGLNGVGAGSRFRMERTERADGVSIINDAYNANPESMLAALQTLAVLGRPDENGDVRRTWAVIGEMRELGEDRVAEHDRIGRLVVRMNISKTLVVGAGAKPTYNAAVMEGSWGEEAAFVETLDEAYDFLQARLEPGDIVLFKSSNASGLSGLGERIAASTGSEG